MKSIVEYINESIRLDEAKKVKVADLLKGLDKIEKWASEKNLKSLEAEYMSAGDAEDLKPGHWKAELEAVKDVIAAIKLYIESYVNGDDVDLADMSEWVADSYEDEANETDFIEDLNKMDVEGDWDEDGIINLFNTVSQKVCKAIWLID